MAVISENVAKGNDYDKDGNRIRQKGQSFSLLFFIENFLGYSVFKKS
jgi:hypothetical protein